MYSRGERKDAAVSVDYHFKIKYKLGTSTRLMKPPAGETALHKLLILKCPQNRIALGGRFVAFITNYISKILVQCTRYSAAQLELNEVTDPP